MMLHGTCSYVWCSILSEVACAGSLQDSILWILLVLSVLQYSSMWCPKYCACWEYEQYEY